MYGIIVSSKYFLRKITSLKGINSIVAQNETLTIVADNGSESMSCYNNKSFSVDCREYNWELLKKILTITEEQPITIDLNNSITIKEMIL